MDERDMTCGELLDEDKELENLREQALSAIMKLPEEKQIEMWNILHKLQLKK